MSGWGQQASGGMCKSLQSCPPLCKPMTIAHNASRSTGFSRHEYWSGLPFPSPGDLPDPGIEPRSPSLEADALTSEPPGKMIQNLENKMALQINRLETRIEKRQKMFNKDLEEIKKSQLIMNNAITEIKSTLREPIVE